MLDGDGTCCLQVCLDSCWIYSASERDPITFCHGKSRDWLQELQWRRSLAKAFRELRRSEHVKAALEVAAPGLMATWQMSYGRFFLPVSWIALAFCLGGWMEGVRRHRGQNLWPTTMKSFKSWFYIPQFSEQCSLLAASPATKPGCPRRRPWPQRCGIVMLWGRGMGWDWEMQHKPQTWKQYDYTWAQ